MRRVVAENHWGLRMLYGFKRGAGARVRQVDDHAQVIHASHHFDSELAQTAVGAFVLAVADVRLAHIRQTGQAYSDTVQHIHTVQLVAESQMLDGGKKRNSTPLAGVQHVVGGGNPEHIGGVLAQVRLHQCDLFKQALEA